ncbi:hypothetical protein ElyMa_004968800 [Elysia marginata]|uniref:Uncharacterized protein n=1 Tax=Elysia marginata TaxID=1093978 RepID=A0AAV4J2F8_9GAST|nr:hypothetical protein ElyMa_004968800 [Elysia marginata]
MEEDPAVREKSTSYCLLVDEKPDVQALQMKEGPLASENKHGSSCYSKVVDWKLDLKHTGPHEHAGAWSKPAEINFFQQGNSLEENLLHEDESFSIKHPDGFEAVFPQYSPVKNEFCVATDDGDLIKTDQSETDLKLKTEEEACIARLEAHVEAYSSTFSSEIKQEIETTEDVEDNETGRQYLIGLNDFQGKKLRLED